MKHTWQSQRMGGAPDVADSYEMVTYCTQCGCELNDSNQDLTCGDGMNYRELLKEWEATMTWSDQSTESERSLVMGNLNGFVAFLESQQAQLKD